MNAAHSRALRTTGLGASSRRGQNAASNDDTPMAGAFQVECRNRCSFRNRNGLFSCRVAAARNASWAGSANVKAPLSQPIRSRICSPHAGVDLLGGAYWRQFQSKNPADDPRMRRIVLLPLGHRPERGRRSIHRNAQDPTSNNRNDDVARVRDRGGRQYDWPLYNGRHRTTVQM